MMTVFLRKEKVLFLCNHNAARSQMAEGLLRYLYGEYFDVRSAGNNPSTLSPYAVQVMSEIGVDISKHRSKSVKEFDGWEYDYVVTVCGSGEVCPVFLGGKQCNHVPFEDPESVKDSEENKIMAFRRVRDALRIWIEKTYHRES
jgi:arsenate reductase (thioredoxin)